MTLAGFTAQDYAQRIDRAVEQAGRAGLDDERLGRNRRSAAWHLVTCVGRWSLGGYD